MRINLEENTEDWGSPDTLIGIWTPLLNEGIASFDNSECAGNPTTYLDIQFSIHIPDDSTFFVEADDYFQVYLTQTACSNLNIYNCGDILDATECVALSMCSWKKSTIYDEKPLEGGINDFPGENLIYKTKNDSDGVIIYDYWTLNPDKEISTDVFEGVNIRINGNVDTARVVNTAWANNSNPNQANINLFFNNLVIKTILSLNEICSLLDLRN